MKQRLIGLFFLTFLMLFGVGCSPVGDKNLSLLVIYITTAIVSVLLIIGYIFFVKEKDAWYLSLFTSVCVVNLGYLALALSKTLDVALMSNRIAYLGSVGLPFFMLMIIARACKLKIPNKIFWGLIVIGAIVFFIAASPGIFDFYYKSVELTTVNGATVLEKEYGILHPVYLFYLVSYLLVMLGVIIHSIKKQLVQSIAHSVILFGAVFINIGLWLLEQLVKMEFEILSISYIISELFLLSLLFLVNENKQPSPVVAASPSELKTDSNVDREIYEHFSAQVERLTPTERLIYDMYLDKKTTKEVMASLNITENTLKYHNKNIYSKLGVSSRKQLVSIAQSIVE